MAATRNDQIVMQALDLLNAGREAEAETLLDGVLKRQPTNGGAAKLKAMILGGREDDAGALIYLQRSVIGEPRDGATRYMLGNVLLNLKRYRDAAAAYREALRLSPGDVAACDGLGKCLISLGQYHEAERVFRAAIAAHPDSPNAYGNMGGVLVAIAKMREAVEVAREGLRRMPNEPALLEMAAFTMNFPEGVDPIELREMHRRMGASYAAKSKRPEPVFTNDPDPERTLRVGFLSGDYSHHACALFMKAPLLNFDRSRLVPVCLSTVRHTDGGDEPFRACCEWCELEGLTEDAIARAILARQLDIVVDCSGLTQGHRLAALVPRVAPVQCTWLGYPNTTGVPTMDYRIVDWLTDPEGTDTHVTEKLLRLPGCFLCYTPAEGLPEPGLTAATADAASEAPITFGCFNRMTKVTPGAVDAWAAILRAVPNSRLLLKLRIASEELRRDAVDLFESRGIDGSRVQMLPFMHHSVDAAGMYRDMDIALDSFPYNGTTTTCEATWMGVPVVVLEGTAHRSRVGVSLNSAMGLSELIGRSVEEYIAIAVRLASDRAALAAFKSSLRGRMAASPLCDGVAYAKTFEQTLRGVWRGWCAARTGR
jgi:predicted O-linked N-acetylglucosamine transferase (SPINDLY family)